MDFNQDRLEAPAYSIENVVTSNHDIRRHLAVPYEQTVTYINGFNEPVAIVERNGIKTILPPQRDRNNINFIVRVTYKVPRDILFDASNILVSDPDITVECSAIIKAGDKIIRRPENAFNESCTFSIDFVIPREKIDRRGGSIYLIERDVIISMHVGNRTPLHPYSKYYLKEKLKDENSDIINENVFGFSIRIVDNNGLFGDRYVNLNGKAYRIPARRDRVLTNGVYFTCTGQAFGNYDLCPPETHKYPFEEADKALNLFRSIEDALSYGDPIKAKEKELEKIKLEHKEKEMVFENEKLDLKRKINDQESELKRRQNEYSDMASRLDHMRKEVEHVRMMEKMGRSDYYDERSSRRKDWTETLKYIPAVITTIGAGYIAWQKISNPTT